MNVIQALIQAKNITSNAQYVGIKNDNGWQAHSWKTWLYVDGIQVYECNYSKGMAFSVNDTPTTQEIIIGLHNDGYYGGESFEQWCAEFGYDDDSRKAFAIYEACQEAASKYEEIFSLEEREAIAECISEEDL